MKLEGIKVIDMSRFLPGPYLTMMMADHGAEVFKIEGAEGEPTRGIGPDMGGQTAYFRNTQRGKKSVVLDLKSVEGRQAFLDLARTSDVIIDSFRPGVVKKLGIDYDTVRHIAPGIVYCSLSAFGQTGALKMRPSHDLGAQAISGVLSLSRDADGRPAMPALPVADIALAMTALSGILMALLRRTATGRGDFLDASMLDALAPWAAPVAHDVFGRGESPDLSRERLYGGSAFYNIYETGDGRHLVLSGSEMRFVAALLNALGRPDLIDHCRKPAGPAHEPVKAFLTETFRAKTLAEWEEWLSEVDVCFAPVRNLAEGLLQPQLRERGVVVERPDGTFRFGAPIIFKEEPGRAADRGPDFGEHTNEIFRRS